MSDGKGKFNLGGVLGAAVGIASDLVPGGKVIGSVLEEVINEVTDGKDEVTDGKDEAPDGKDDNSGDKPRHPGNRRMNRRRRMK